MPAADALLLPRVQGIRSSIFDITLRGDKFTDRVGGALMDGTLVRKMVGATELKLEILDRGARLLNSGLLDTSYSLELDGLDFDYVSYGRPGLEADLELEHEAQVVHRLRQLHGPHKAFRDEMTRAEFAKARVMELKPPRPRFVCPELHKVQPIKSPREGRKAAKEAEQTRSKGIGNVKLKVKTARASSQQIAVGDRALRVAETEEADTRVMIALMEALIAESEVGAASNNFLQITGGTAGAGGVDPTNLEAAVRGFLHGYYHGQEGAIEYFKNHPQAKAYEIAQAVQASGAGLASKGAANYGPWADEAGEWVSAYGGGADVVEPLRFPFEEKEKEDHWKCLNALAQPVNWRCFESAGWVYFIAEPTLFKSHTRLLISDSTPGVLDTTIKGDEGKPHEEVTVEALASIWAAPPGTVAELSNHGPADGPYLVDRIEAPLVRRDAPLTVTLKRPTKPKAEPANPTRTRKVGGSVSSSLAPPAAPPAIGKMIARMVELNGTPYVWGGGHGAFEKKPKGLDCSGAISDVLNAAGLLSAPEATGALESFGEAGKGKWITIWVTNSGVGHTWAEVLTTEGWKQWEEGGNLSDHAGWTNESQAGYVPRHPKGL